MRAASTLTAIGAALWFVVPSAHALGFGRITNATELGQPLNFAVAVRQDAGESLSRECVSAEALSGDNKLQPGQIRATLEGPTDAADRSVRVTSTTIIDEPVVTVTVTLGCNAKVSRKFVLFIDPPLINLAQASPTPSLPPQRVDTQVAPIVTLVQGERRASAAANAPQRPSPRARPRAPVGLSRVSESGVRAAPAPVSKSAKPRRAATALHHVAAAHAAPGGPRLELESSPTIVALAASAPGPLAPVAAPAATASAASAANANPQVDEVARERQRIRGLEEGLATLSRESQATQKSLATLQAQLKDAESQRYANPLVYALAWLSALLALAVAGLWWRQSRARRSAQWWAASSLAATPARAGSTDPAGSAPMPLGVASTAADAFEVSGAVEHHDPRALAAPGTRSGRYAASAPAPMVPMAPEPARELSVDELIDLEQQAEFFIVLGQDEAAIELLMSHVRSDGGISPLPYLKLLEIYRRLGNHEAYQRIRERFNRRFNAYAPGWESDLQQGRVLADYLDIIARLQEIWSTPMRVMEMLDALLFRRSQTGETFDLPAYRELLFLYSIAHDLAEHAATLARGEVDLLLPLGADAAATPISRLSASMAPGDFQPSDMATMPLDLDVSIAPADDPADPTRSVPPTPRGGPDPAEPGRVDFDLSDPAAPRKTEPSGNR